MEILDDVIIAIAELDTKDEQYKLSKQENVEKMKRLKNVINDYCDINEKLQYAIVFVLGFVLGSGIVTYIYSH